MDRKDINDRSHINLKNDRNKLKNTIYRFITMLSFPKVCAQFAYSLQVFISSKFDFQSMKCGLSDILEFSFRGVHVSILLKFI